MSNVKVNLKEKRKQEIIEDKEKRKEDVIRAAIRVIRNQSIEEVKMTQIAEEAGVGVASVYRYFKTKLELALEAGNWLWNEEINKMYIEPKADYFEQYCGAQKVEHFLRVFIKIYKEYPEFFIFLEQFDNYMVKAQVETERLEQYEVAINRIKETMLAALESGKEDGSIRPGLDSQGFYMTTTHSLMSLSQKLIIRGNLLHSDRVVSGEEQLETMIQMALCYIKPIQSEERS